MCDFKPELSKKSKYYIPKERYYELKHFCLQYPIWEKTHAALDAGIRTGSIISTGKGNNINDPVFRAVLRMDEAYTKMMIVVKSCSDADLQLSNYILKAVTEGRSYDWLFANLQIPCGRDMFYDRLRKFYYILDLRRDSQVPFEDVV